MISKASKVLLQLAIAFDQLVNCIIWIKNDGFGYADETLSEWRLNKQSRAWRRIDAIFFWEEEHCKNL